MVIDIGISFSVWLHATSDHFTVFTSSSLRLCRTIFTVIAVSANNVLLMCIQSDVMAPRSKLDSQNMTLDTDDVDLLKQQVCSEWRLSRSAYRFWVRV